MSDPGRDIPGESSIGQRPRQHEGRENGRRRDGVQRHALRQQQAVHAETQRCVELPAVRSLSSIELPLASGRASVEDRLLDDRLGVAVALRRTWIDGFMHALSRTFDIDGAEMPYSFWDLAGVRVRIACVERLLYARADEPAGVLELSVLARE